MDEMIAAYTERKVCKECFGSFEIWNNDVIVDAWQKNEYNHYKYKCPCCGYIDKFRIAIKD
jgi:hypothetical protein